MKKHFILIVILMLAACNDAPDRREKQLTADSLLALPTGSIFSNPDRLDRELEEAQNEVTDSLLYYRLELHRAFADYVRGRTDDYATHHRNVEDYCHRHQGTELLDGFRLNNRAVVCQLNGNRDSAIVLLRQAERRMAQGGADKELIPVCINLADNYFQHGKLPEAARYYRRALFLSDSTQTDRSLVAINSGLGQVYTALHNFTEAHRYFDVVESMKDRASAYEKYHFHNSLGNCYYAERRYREALTAFQTALTEALSMQNEPGVRLVTVNIGEIHLKLGNLDSAAVYLGRVEAALTPETDEAMRFYVNSLMAELALCRHDVTRAGSYLEQPYDTASLGPYYLALHYRRLYDYYEQRRDYERANSFLHKAMAYEDSLRNGQVMSYTVEARERYAQDTAMLNQNLQLAVYRSRVSRQQSYIALGGVIICLLALGTVLLSLHHRRKDARHYARHLATVTRLRMSIVRNRVSPHFIFNVLGTVLPRFREKPELERPINMLVDVLRDSLVFSERLTVTLDEELSLVRHFVALKTAMSSSNMPHVEWDIAPEADRSLRVPTMCLQIPVENALKHAFGPVPPPEACVEIHVRTKDDGLLMDVADNGKGFRPGGAAPSENSTGSGLRMMAHTVELLNQRNQRKMSFDIKTRTGTSGTVVSMFIPRDYDFELPTGDFVVLKNKT